MYSAFGMHIFAQILFMGKVVNAFTNDALGRLDAVGVAEAIAKGEITVAEATEAAIKRAEKVNAELNAIAFKTYDAARNETAINKKGAFYGVPSFIKDTDNIVGTPTQMGTLAFKSKVAKRNSKFVNQFFSTGLNSIGKSTMPEFGLICSTENEKWGVTRNPWNTDYTTGGSSSGSGALVATGVVPIASANDGAGSIRIPASCCGLVGLKPSRHRLENADGGELLPLNIVCQGVLTRTVRDTAAFYAAAEKYFRNPKYPEIGLVQGAGKKRLRIAYFENIAEGKLGNQDAETLGTIEKTAKLLKGLGHEVEQLRFPFSIEDLADHFLNYYGFLAYALSNWGGLILKAKVDKLQLEPFTTGLSGKFRSNALKITKSLRMLKQTGVEVEKLFDNYDLIMTPVLAHNTPKIGYFSTDLAYDEISKRAVSFAPYTGFQNVSGAPAISLPMAVNSEGMPMGIQFVAPIGQDKRLIELAFEIEQAQPWPLIYDSKILAGV